LQAVGSTVEEVEKSIEAVITIAVFLIPTREVKIERLTSDGNDE
jgi:hypothetical protein